MIEIVELLRERGVEFDNIQDNIVTERAAGKAMFRMLSALVEFERDIRRSGTIAGLKAACARGKKGVGDQK